LFRPPVGYTSEEDKEHPETILFFQKIGIGVSSAQTMNPNSFAPGTSPARNIVAKESVLKARKL
jgi:hypothetical protein